jgi:hypothetical protein
MEPWRLKHWCVGSSRGNRTFYTCARPGRSKGSRGNVPDRLVNEWVSRLPASPVTILSLLGLKPDGTNEWSFYSFYRSGRSFQEWLDQSHNDKTITVIEHPTCDMQLIPNEKLRVIALRLMNLVSDRKAVVLMDSGGIQRTGQVCKFVDAVEVARLSRQ